MDRAGYTKFRTLPELALEDLLIASAESATTPADEDEAGPAPEAKTGDVDKPKPRRRPRVSEATPRV